jgi:hypothetical protein
MMKEKHGAINTFLNLKLHLKFEVQLIKLMEFLYLYILHNNPSIMFISSINNCQPL